ncbi:MAG: NADPH-dependent oxidoreductase [Peptoniphilaceae bacterium]
MNKTIETMKSHRTIRKFKDQRVDQEIIENILEVFNRAASSTGLQETSIIHVTDQKIKDEITKVSTQEYLADVPELFIFIVDIYRNYRIAKDKGFESENFRDMDRFFQGFTDSVIGSQNVVNALESLGLGAVYFGSILNDYDRIIELLDLPKLTFPVVGLGFGYPDQDPQLKPKMDISLKYFENKYKIYENYMEEVKNYDEEMTYYYDTRANGRRSDSFSNQVVSRFKNIIEKRRDVIASIERQGFKIRP